MPKVNKSGFTLIELLIVITIIVILTALLAVSYTTIQRNARDAQRKGDLQSLAGAFERFYTDNSTYPASQNGEIGYNNATCASDSGLTFQPWGDNTSNIDCNGTSYLRILPQDPIGTVQYCYEATNSNQRYNLYAQMEGRGNLDLPVSCNGIDYNYRITSND